MPNDRLCRWARWGRDHDALRLDNWPKLKAYLAEQLGPLHDPPDQPAALESIQPPPSRLPNDLREALTQHLGPDQISLDDHDRLIHSVGRSYRDVVRAWTGRVDPVTDAVIYPRNEADVTAILQTCSKAGIAVVPFGGGTSVVGGVEPRTTTHHAVVTLDTMHLAAITIDSNSHLAEIGAGAFGPDIERTLNAAGFTLGHFPQSFEFSALGGWIAARGAGQESTRYGKIEEMVKAVRILTPTGPIETPNVPATASGPSILQSVIGSEGTLGVITSAIMHVHRIPETTRYAAFLVPTFDAGCRLLRRLAQTDPAPSVVRLSDPEETRWLSMSSSDEPSALVRIAKAYFKHLMRRRNYDQSQTCMVILSYAGNPATTSIGNSPDPLHRQRHSRHPHRRHPRPAMAYRPLSPPLPSRRTAKPPHHGRHSRDRHHLGKPPHPLQRRPRRHRPSHPRRRHPRRRHVSPLPHLSRQARPCTTPSSPASNPTAKSNNGSKSNRPPPPPSLPINGTLSHHHGIGYEHQPLAAEYGPAAVAALAAAKTALDPAGIMNPGKLLAD